MFYEPCFSLSESNKHGNLSHNGYVCIGHTLYSIFSVNVPNLEVMLNTIFHGYNTLKSYTFNNFSSCHKE